MDLFRKMLFKRISKGHGNFPLLLSRSPICPQGKKYRPKHVTDFNAHWNGKSILTHLEQVLTGFVRYAATATFLT